MKLYFEIAKLLFNKLIKKEKNGEVIKKFVERMGISYIKFAQILATQNVGNLFTEEDRKILSKICDNCNPIPFDKIEKILKEEYGNDYKKIFPSINTCPVGSASISQVHQATLASGEVVAIKIKRKDITNTIEKDIIQMKKIVKRFGWIIDFKNFSGGDKALDLYFDWIQEETNFQHEIENIKLYSEFANNVNGKMENAVDIKVPKLYEKLCTENVIVMEYIDSKTINKMPLDDENKNKIAKGLNSYFKLSFYAFFNDQQIVFHGDPHEGNIYIDDDGNIGFLDMGLLFVLEGENARLMKELFSGAYLKNYEKIFNLLIPYGKMNNEEREKFKEDIKVYCEEVRSKDITHYYTDVIPICMKYEITPPNFLFCMAKAFVCLNGMNGISLNTLPATELLKEQVIEFLLKRSMQDSQKLVKQTARTIPKLAKSVCEYGVSKGITKEIMQSGNFLTDTRQILENYLEVLAFIKIQIQENNQKNQRNF